MLDPTFLSSYVRAVTLYPANYGTMLKHVFNCINDCSDCPLDTDSGCGITVQRDLLGIKCTAGDFERDYVAPVLRESHPEFFI